MVTHDQLLRNPAMNVANFLASGPLALEEKLGPFLWQISEYLAFQPTVVEEFLAVLPHSIDEARQLIEQYATTSVNDRWMDAPNRPIRHAFEVRHPSFSNPRFLELLRRYDVAIVVTNTPRWPEFRDITSDFAYVRLHGDVTTRPNGYSDADLDEWATLINGWLSGEGCADGRGRDVFVYFDNPDNRGTRSPFDAIRLQERLDGPRRPRTETPVQPALWG
ncbi:uncharacterized protein YecE (DUF72 family) [Glaciihabitans sp. UYNi722]